MHVTEMTCDGFRCLRGIVFRPSPAINVIRGHNAQGKTSLLEALLFLATSKSHRTNTESELVRHGTDGFRLTAAAWRQGREVTIEANWWNGTKRLRVNGVAQARMSEILGKLNVVFFSPEDVSLVRGSAASRRRYLDMAISQLAPAYLHALQQYRLVVRQRNELLRAPRPDESLLTVWDAQLAEHGAVLVRERQLFVEQLSERTCGFYRAIAQEEELSLTYRPDVRLDVPLLDALTGARATDLRQRLTTRGPHRDDLDFAIGGKPARHFASQGQQRSAVLALKLAELDLVKDRTGEYPVLMLDDVLSELDAMRSQRFFGVVHRGVQCLVTTAGVADKDMLCGADCTYFSMRSGRLIKQ